MSRIESDERPEQAPRAPWTPDEGPEPAWADAIRRGRKAHADRLREVFDRFGDDGADATTSSRLPSDGGDGS